MSIPDAEEFDRAKHEIRDAIINAGMTSDASYTHYLIKTLGDLPTFGGGAGQVAYAKLHHDHYQRLCAVLDAARTGNDLLIRLAVEHQNQFGIGPTPDKD